MKTLAFVLLLLLYTLPVQAQGVLTPSSVAINPLPIRTKVSFLASFQEFGLGRSSSDHIHLSCSGGLTADPSELYVDYEDPVNIIVTFDTNVAGCYGFNYPMGIWAHDDSDGVYQLLYVTAYAYDPYITGKFQLDSNTLNFGMLSVKMDDSLSLGLEADSIGMTYRKLLVHGVQLPFYSADTIDPNICESRTNTFFHFKPTAPGFFRHTVYLLDSVINDSIPLILIGEGVAASVGNSAEETSRIAVSPNPCDKHCNLSMTDGQTEHVIVRNLLGESVLDFSSLHNDEFSISTASLPNGIYFIEARSDENVYRERVIVAH